MQTRVLDAQAALAFVLSQVTYVERAVNEIIYPDIQYQSLVPVDTSAPEWTKSVTYFSSDKFGKAEWLNGNADDVPRAGSERTMFSTNVYLAAIGYGYGLEEISQAALAGVNLTSDDAAAARRAYEEFVDGVALRGDASKGFVGMFNNPGAIAITAPNGNWASQTITAQQVLADINAALLPTFVGTLYTSIADTLILPFERFQRLGEILITGTNETLLQFVQRANVYTFQTGRPLTIRGAYGLMGAGAGGTNRMVAYLRDPRVLKMHIPMPHKFLPVYQAGPLRWEVPGIFRLGGLDLRLPQSFRYLDGI